MVDQRDGGTPERRDDLLVSVDTLLVCLLIVSTEPENNRESNHIRPICLSGGCRVLGDPIMNSYCKSF